MPPYQYDKYRNSSKISSGLRWKVLLRHIRLYYCGSSKTRIHGTRMGLFLTFILKYLNYKNVREMEGIVLRTIFNYNVLDGYEVLLFWNLVFKGNLISGATGDITKLIISINRDGSFLLDGQIFLCQYSLQVGLWKHISGSQRSMRPIKILYCFDFPAVTPFDPTVRLETFTYWNREWEKAALMNWFLSMEQCGCHSCT